MHPEIEKLIDLALADGQITEKERNVILKKASELGVDSDEVEMVLDGKFHQLEAHKPKQKEKFGNVKTCPTCGAILKSFQVTCICGHEFVNADSNKSIGVLLSELKSLKKINNESDHDFEVRVANRINNTPIPVTKEDLLEFLSICSSQSDVGFMAQGHGIIVSAWSSKGNEALLKAKIAFIGDEATQQILLDFEKKLKSSSRNSNMFLLFILLLLIVGLIGILLA